MLKTAHRDCSYVAQYPKQQRTNMARGLSVSTLCLASLYVSIYWLVMTAVCKPLDVWLHNWVTWHHMTTADYLLILKVHRIKWSEGFSAGLGMRRGSSPIPTSQQGWNFEWGGIDEQFTWHRNQEQNVSASGAFFSCYTVLDFCHVNCSSIPPPTRS